MSVEDLIRELRQRGFAVLEAPTLINGQAFVLVDSYRVEIGPHTGKLIGLAFPMPYDFPITPPGGIHVRPHLIPIGTRNVHQSPLGAEWEYWSRPIVAWRKDRSVGRLLSHVNRLMRDA